MNARAESAGRGLAALRRMTASQPRQERCELCAARVPERHQHLVDPQNRRIVCACDACAILFDTGGVTHYRRVPRDVRSLPGFDIDDSLWNSLGIPIGLVFFFHSSASKSVLAVYPSPGGPAEVPVEADQWCEISALHPALAAMPEDVEALLVNRIKGAREYLIAPIDECYQLTGIVRSRWSGFSGGDALWDEIGRFFDRLKQGAYEARSAGHA